MKSLSKHLLYPADIFAEKAPSIVSTVLGSCVSVCLYDPVLQVGAVNHYILPNWNRSDEATMKYGSISIILIIREMLLFGCKLENMIARVYGGAEVLRGMPTNFHIGSRNAQIAFEILNEFRIPVLSSDVGGMKGRKITFNTLTGEVEMDYIRYKDTRRGN